jgi:hypothetical protein
LYAGIDPNGFTQYVNLLVCKAQALTQSSEMLNPVVNRWKTYADAGPWTIYEGMQKDPDGRLFSEQTFMVEVQACINKPTQTGERLVSQHCQGSSGQCSTYEKTYKYGVAVEDWLNQTRDKGGALLTGDGPDNKS